MIYTFPFKSSAIASALAVRPPNVVEYSSFAGVVLETVAPIFAMNAEPALVPEKAGATGPTGKVVPDVVRPVT